MTEIDAIATVSEVVQTSENAIIFSCLPDMIIRTIFEWVETGENWILKYDDKTRRLQYKINMKKILRDFDAYTMNINEILFRRLYWKAKEVDIVIQDESCPGMEYTLTKVDDTFFGGKIIEQYIVFQRNDRDEYLHTFGSLEYSDDHITTPEYWYSETYYSYDKSKQQYKDKCSISHSHEHAGENYMNNTTRIVSVYIPEFTLDEMHEFKKYANEIGETEVAEIDVNLYRQFNITHWDYSSIILPKMNEINNTSYSFDFCISQIARMEFNPHLNVYEKIATEEE
jgi:hypothetical protein